ncbi:MAG: glycoside hydrolase family 2, partial [Erysipelotrichaceae bacterium]|nr:glycoside hydrolase family 2 [Erysipelotrichaceae bacterium]
KKEKITDKRRYDFFLDQARETIRHLRSHPSLFAYTIYNEGWGQQGASEAYEVLKKEDPSRLFDSASGWFKTEKTDFDSYHIYFRNKVLPAGKKLLFLSECGGFTRKIEGHAEEKKSYGYGKTDSEEGLTDTIGKMHEKMVLPSIRNGLVGVVMTQVSDVEGEINGLYTYDRTVCKVDRTRIKELNNRLQKAYEEALDESR